MIRHSTVLLRSVNGVRIAIGLYLGSTTIYPTQCGSNGGRWGFHGLSCPCSAGGHNHHTVLNVNVPYCKEPQGRAQGQERPVTLYMGTQNAF